MLFSPGGRTGNQLFQAAHAQCSRRGSEWLLTLRFGSTRSLLAGRCRRHWYNLDFAPLCALIERFVYPVILRVLVETGIFSSHLDRGAGVIFRKGKIRLVTVMKGYFESSEDCLSELRAAFRLKSSLRNSVAPLVAGIPSGMTPVFVHVRRTDLLEKGLQLPDSYYARALTVLQDKQPGLFVFVIGDDPAYEALLFKEVTNKMISFQSAEKDLALMSLCSGGVLSNSTFAWWGAFFGQNKLGYVAPRYWSGWASEIWNPSRIQSFFMTHIMDVMDSRDSGK